ncbi:MAG: Hsp70 family protein [Deltaproteobacteria bacterium]|nr:Hsp70 family protein [Deltaproteobacteria bacterium]
MEYYNRRKDERVKYPLLIRLEGEKSGVNKDFATNISRGGCFVHTHAPPEVGQTVKFEILKSNGEVLFSGEGVVVWRKTESEDKREHGCGIKFTRLSPDSIRIIEEIVAQEVEKKGAVKEFKDGRDLESQRTVLGPSIKKSRKIIGIDLGTTYSCVSSVVNNKPIVIPSRQGYRTVPSIVAINEKGKLLVGNPAREQLLINPKNTVYGAKRLIGRKYKSKIVQDIKSRFSYEILEGENDNCVVSIANTIFTLEEISSFILRELKEIAETFFGEEINRAVITVPAYYNESQRQAVKEAGRLAGLDVERILNEPTAAAIAFGFFKGMKKRIMVYDLGGGTFDVSIMDIHDNVFEVLSTGGDTFLGGVDFDTRIVNYIVQEFYKQYNVDLSKDMVVMQRLLFAAENAKIELSSSFEKEVHIPFVSLINGKAVDIRQHLTRQKVEELTSDLVDRTIIVCEEVLSAKGIDIRSIDEILLVGGQSRMPLVRKKIKEYFGKEPHKGVHPDEAVGIGAALIADSILRNENVLLIDVLPMSVGISLDGKKYLKVIPRNSQLPTERSITLLNSEDYVSEMKLSIYQGESPFIEANEIVGELTIFNIPRVPKGGARINVKFSVDPESIFKIQAIDLKSGESLPVRFINFTNRRDLIKVRVNELSDTTNITQEGVENSSQKDETLSKKGFINWLRKLFSK